MVQSFRLHLVSERNSTKSQYTKLMYFTFTFIKIVVITIGLTWYNHVHVYMARNPRLGLQQIMTQFFLWKLHGRAFIYYVIGINTLRCILYLNNVLHIKKWAHLCYLTVDVDLTIIEKSKEYKTLITSNFFLAFCRNFSRNVKCHQANQ